MKKSIKYTEGEIGDIKIIEDFLPTPEELAFKDENMKITISLTKDTVDFFKEEAKKHHTQYQKMIRNLLDLYVDKQTQQ
ncbi:MAG: CopG family transcriptional regulator [Helicobacteraceae bacterium]|nr:CopG family transcriptional regulator [Candidatus Sulfurimonas ponti]